MGCELNYKIIIQQILYLFIETISNINSSVSDAFSYLKNRIFINSKEIKKEEKNNVIKAVSITVIVAGVIIILLSSADTAFGSIFFKIAKNILLFISKANLWSLIWKIIV